MFCPRCGTQAGPGQGFCTRCGAKMTPVCPACGREVPAGQSFCGGCGAQVGAAAPPVAAPQPPAYAAPPSYAPPPPPAYAPPVYAPPPPAQPVYAPPPAAPPSPAHAPAAPASAPAPAPPPAPRSGCKRLFIILFVLALLAAGAAAYFGLPDGLQDLLGEGSGASESGSGKLDADARPVEFTRPTGSVGGNAVLGRPLFVFQMKNVSRVDLTAVEAVAVLFDSQGKRLPGPGQELDLGGGAGDIHPGDSYECKFMAGSKDAASAAIVLKEAVYVFVPPGKTMSLYRVPTKWTNGRFDAELEAAKP